MSNRQLTTCANGHRSTVPPGAVIGGGGSTYSCPECGLGLPKPEVNFACKVCGVQCPISPADGSGAICEKHCRNHSYYYEPGEGHRCETCFAEPPDDWFRCDDDVI